MWWGKIICTFFGFMLGGILGGILGFIIGNMFDQGLKKHIKGFYFGYTPGSTSRAQEVFFKATFAVMGHIAKSDGRVTEKEIHVANQVMQRLGLQGELRKTAIQYFSEGKSVSFNLAETLHMLKAYCGHNKIILQLFMDIQVQTAIANGYLAAAKKELLFKIAEQIGLSYQFQYGYTSGQRSQQSSYNQSSLADDYHLLGVTKTASESEVKKAYRRLMSQHHPDKLIAKGLPEEMIKVATEKTQKIKAAYERIIAARKQSYAA